MAKDEDSPAAVTKAREEERLRLRAEIFGVVQGVGYRMFAQREATRLGLSGFVRNCEDGSVETVAEGPRRALEQYVDRLRAGPLGAEVRDLRVEWGPAQGSFQGFHIRD